MKQLLVLLSIGLGLILSSAATAGCLTVIKPNGGERWPSGSTQQIQWHNTCRKPVKVLFRKNGTNLGILHTSDTSTNGNFFWNITTPPTNGLTIIVQTMDGREMDESNQPFSLIANKGTGYNYRPKAWKRPVIPANHIMEPVDPYDKSSLKSSGVVKKVQHPGTNMHFDQNSREGNITQKAVRSK